MTACVTKLEARPAVLGAGDRHRSTHCKPRDSAIFATIPDICVPIMHLGPHALRRTNSAHRANGNTGGTMLGAGAARDDQALADMRNPRFTQKLRSPVESYGRPMRNRGSCESCAQEMFPGIDGMEL